MTDDAGDGRWPVELRGVTESVVATLGPNDRWNLAALGLRTGEFAADGAATAVTARTWGRTRTWRNFQREGSGVVQFLRDPVTFVDAALGIDERETPVDDSADAWVQVRVERVDSGTADGTEWVDWALEPRSTCVRERDVRTIDRGFNAVVEATVWASRLDVEGYDDGMLRRRLDFLGDVVDASGGERTKRAFERIHHHVSYRE